MSSTYGTKTFYYQTFKELVEQEYVEKRTFRKPKKKVQMIDKEVRETDEQLWKRINEFIQNYNLTIINFETVVRTLLPVGNWAPTYQNIYNDNRGKNEIIGYRLFYNQGKTSK